MPTDPKEEVCEVCGLTVRTTRHANLSRPADGYCFDSGNDFCKARGYERLLKERQPAASALPSVDLEALLRVLQGLLDFPNSKGLATEARALLARRAAPTGGQEAGALEKQVPIETARRRMQSGYALAADLLSALRAVDMLLIVLEKGDQSRPVVMVSGMVANARAIVREALSAPVPPAPVSTTQRWHEDTGWPICPTCDEDELYSLATPATATAIDGCYRCGSHFDPPKDFSRTAAAPPSAPQEGLFKEGARAMREMAARLCDEQEQCFVPMSQAASAVHVLGNRVRALPLPAAPPAPLSSPSSPASEKEQDNGSKSEIPVLHGGPQFGAGPDVHVRSGDERRGKQELVEVDADRLADDDGGQPGRADVRAGEVLLPRLHGSEVATPVVVLKEGTAPALGVCDRDRVSPHVRNYGCDNWRPAPTETARALNEEKK